MAHHHQRSTAPRSPAGSSSRPAARWSSAVTLVGCRMLERPAKAAAARNSLDAALTTSWFEIHADNTILIRTGKVDFGQTTAHTAYRQIVAEELSVPFEAITTVVMGDTDRTPDGGFSAGYLEYGGANLQEGRGLHLSGAARSRRDRRCAWTRDSSP